MSLTVISKDSQEKYKTIFPFMKEEVVLLVPYLFRRKWRKTEFTSPLPRGEILHTDAPQPLMGLHSDKPSVYWKYYKLKIHLIHTLLNIPTQPILNVLRTLALARSWEKSWNTKPVL